MGPTDSMKKWLENDLQAPLPTYISEEEKKRITDVLLNRGGMRAPLLWYNFSTSGLRAKEEKCEIVMLDSGQFMTDCHP
jgi:soluble epoxide hydrolase / lipid-phosphate phosphatase